MSRCIEKLTACIPPEADAVLLTSWVNQLYYTGYNVGLLFSTREESFLLVDFRNYEEACQKVTACPVVLLERQEELLSQLFAKYAVKTLAVDADRITVTELARMREQYPGLTILEDSRLSEAISAQRRIKSPEELAKVEQAQRLTDEAFTYILDFIRPGRTEREIALELEFYLRKNGAEGPSFNFIVVSDPGSSLPHGRPTGKEIQKGEFLTMDYGALFEGYHSDMTRTVAIGQVDEEHRRLYNTVLKAQTAAIDAIALHMKCCQVDKVARDIIDQAGYQGCFGHGLGHGVGLENHEPSAFNTRCQDPVVPGMVMTVEPGIYLQGRFGCRIEDMVYIGEDGVRNLTKSEKSLIEL